MIRAALIWMSSILVALATPAFADSTCQGRVTQTNIAVDGTVLADWGFGTQRVCNMNGNFSRNTENATYGTTPITADVCSTLLAQLLTAKASGRDAAAVYGHATCPTPLTDSFGPYEWRFPQ